MLFINLTILFDWWGYGKNENVKENIKFEEMAYKVGKMNFKSLWEKEKKELKQMSKKDLTEIMFNYGIEHVITGMYVITNNKNIKM